MNAWMVIKGLVYFVDWIHRLHWASFRILHMVDTKCVLGAQARVNILGWCPGCMVRFRVLVRVRNCHMITFFGPVCICNELILGSGS